MTNYVISYDPDQFGGTAFYPKLLKCLSETALRFVPAKGWTRFCPKPLESEQVFVQTSGNHITHPYLLCTFISIRYTVLFKLASKHMIFLLLESRVSHVCSEADSHQGRGGLFLWSDSIPKHASSKNVLIDL